MMVMRDLLESVKLSAFMFVCLVVGFLCVGTVGISIMLIAKHMTEVLGFSAIATVVILFLCVAAIASVSGGVWAYVERKRS